MRRRSNVIRRQGQHHLGRQLVDLCLAFQGFGEPGAPGLHDGLLRPGFVPMAGRGNRRVPAFLETCARPAWSFGQGLPSILVAGDSDCWTVARSGGRRLLRTTLPASWDSGPVAGSSQDGCFSRRGAGRRHPATIRRGGRLPRPAWAATLGNGVPGSCAASGPRRRPSGWTDPGARSARHPQELPARLPDRPWRRCHDADWGCTIGEP